MSDTNSNLKQAATTTPELVELSATAGSTVDTGFVMAADGKIDSKDLGPLLNYVLANVEGFKGAGTAVGPELASATEPDLIQCKAAFKSRLSAAVPAKTKYTTTEVFSGLLCGVHLIKVEGVAEGRELGRAELIAELRSGAITFDQVVSGSVI